MPGAGILFLRPDANPVNDIIDMRRMLIFKFSDNSPQGNFGELQLPERVLNSINQKVSTGLSEEMFRTVVDGSEASVFFSFSLLDESEQLTILILKIKTRLEYCLIFSSSFFFIPFSFFHCLLSLSCLKLKLSLQIFTGSDSNLPQVFWLSQPFQFLHLESSTVTIRQLQMRKTVT